MERGNRKKRKTGPISHLPKAISLKIFQPIGIIYNPKKKKKKKKNKKRIKKKMYNTYV